MYHDWVSCLCITKIMVAFMALDSKFPDRSRYEVLKKVFCSILSCIVWGLSLLNKVNFCNISTLLYTAINVFL
jgi:hypothetical protein